MGGGASKPASDGQVSTCTTEPAANAEKANFQEIKENQKVFHKLIDDIWKTYDIDNSGLLDRIEMKSFFEEFIQQAGAAGEEYANQSFTEVFSKFDLNNSGTIDKVEMKVFLKKVVGL